MPVQQAVKIELVINLATLWQVGLELRNVDANYPFERSHFKDELACRGFVCRTLHRLGLNVETIKPNGRPAVGIGWVPPEHAD